MNEKLREAAAALREAAEDCTRRAAEYVELADRLSAIAVNQLQLFAAEPAAKHNQVRRGQAPKAGRKRGRRAGLQARVVRAAVQPKAEKPNGNAGEPKPAADPPAVERTLTPSGRIPRGSLDAPFVRYIGERPGIGPSHVAQHFKIDVTLARNILKRLAREKQLDRQGGGFHPVASDVEAKAN